MSDRIYYVYILANKNNSTIYTGITNDLVRRTFEHKSSFGSKFTSKYRTFKLVYYESFGDPERAIMKEKSIKNLVRRKKNLLIEKMNPRWKDLYEEILSAA